MKIITAPSELLWDVRDARRRGALVGLVPTMGFLHEGHASLIRRARAECDLVVVSIFVNPLQFGEGEDFDSYPRDLDGDVALAADTGADLVFAPEVGDIYPTEVKTTIHVDSVSEGLCGDHRPGHFDGVATVVANLFNLAEPDRAYFGNKDAQQVAVIRQMAHDLNFPVEIVACPTVRESDGLAMSSRNAYLTETERISALALVKSLRKAADRICEGERSAREIERVASTVLTSAPLVAIEYAQLRDASTMAPVEFIDEGRFVLAVAARVAEGSGSGARLIDNFVFEVSGGEVSVDEGVLASAAGVEATSLE
ncbi:MAG: pantoate--beta-alanine ligase [Acidobacteria bacterium]|nr:MAG: pantoate--beta-alanine ligase [Acidobacteriota bacterium]